VAICINNMYFSGSRSELEVNVSQQALTALSHLVQEGKFDEHLYDGLESIVIQNIADTWSRFVQTSDFTKRMAEMTFKAGGG